MALSTASNVTAAGSVGPGCTVPLGQTGHIGQPTGATVNNVAGLGPPTQVLVGSIPNPGGPTPGFHHEFLETAAVCFCHRFLNPFGGGPMSLTTTGSNSQCLVNPCLLHYCRVCNIQLNSCRQAKIHSEGKKHEKRLSYLKFCLESTDSIGTNGTLPSNQAQVAQQQVQTCPVPQPSSATSQPQQSVVPGPSPPTMAPQPVAASVVSSSSIGGTTVYYGQGPPVQTVASSALPPPQAMAPVPQQQAPLQPYQPAYYYPHPAAAQPQHPPNAASVTTSVQPPLSQQPGVPATIAGTHPGAPQGYIYSYPDYTTPPPQVPTMMMVPPIPPPGPHPQHLDPYHQAVPTSVTGGPPVPQPQPLLQTQHGVMSPSLTSGFSGSGADCKSTETSSILSAASYSSGAAPHVNTNYNSYGDHSQYYSNKKGSGGYHHNNNSSHYYNNNAANSNTLDYSNMGSYNGHHSHSHGASSNPSSWSYGSSSNNSSSSSSKNNQSTGTNNHGNSVTGTLCHGNNSSLQQQFNSKLTGVSNGGHQLTLPNGTNVTNNSNSNSHGTSNNINNNNNNVQLMPVDHVTSSSRNNNKSSAVNGAGQSKDSSHGHDRGRSDRAGALAIQLPATVFCETCQIAFPSMAVLENHLKGSRHARRVKSQQAFRQLKDAGTLFRIRGSSASVTDIGMSSGAIRCEVCQVSVNSSHQLQAHLTGHKHRVRAIRRGVKTNQAVLSPSSSLLTSSASVSEMSYQSNGTSRSRDTGTHGLISGSGGGENSNRRAHSERAYSERAEKNKGKSDNTNNNKKKNNVRDSSAITTKENNNNNSKQTAEQTNKREQQRSSSGKNNNNNNNNKIKNKQDNREANQPTQTKALSRHRSSGCLQSRHCHSTLSLSRARSSSALNRVQSRSMNLLMIQNNNNKNQSNNAVVVKTQSKKEVGGGGGDQRKTSSKNSGGSKRNSTKTASGDSSNVSSGCNMKTASSDVLSLASNSETCSSGNPRSDLEDEEDEGVATDATTEGNAPVNGSKTKDIKANSGKTRSKFRENNRAKINKDDKEMAWVRLSNGEVAKRTKLKTRKGGDESSADSRRNDKKNIIPHGTTHHEKQNNKIFKRGFNVNAQEWKPSSRRTSVGNASVKDIPMLDVFLQRLDQRHTNYNSDQASPTSNEQ